VIGDCLHVIRRLLFRSGDLFSFLPVYTGSLENMVSFVGFLFFLFRTTPTSLFPGDGFVCESLVSEGTRLFRFRRAC
jgi:hypothetical protein